MPRIKMPLWPCLVQQLTPLDQHRVARVKVIWSPGQRLEQLLSSQNPFLTTISALPVPSLTLTLYVVLFEDFEHLLSVFKYSYSRTVILWNLHLSSVSHSHLNFSLLRYYSNVSVWHSLHGGWFLQAIKAMEVPVVKIREGEAGGEEKMMIKSIVNMVQYCVCVTVWHWGGECCMDIHCWWTLPNRVTLKCYYCLVCPAVILIDHSVIERVFLFHFSFIITTNAHYYFTRGGQINKSPFWVWSHVRETFQERVVWKHS